MGQGGGAYEITDMVERRPMGQEGNAKISRGWGKGRNKGQRWRGRERKGRRGNGNKIREMGTKSDSGPPCTHPTNAMNVNTIA